MKTDFNSFKISFAPVNHRGSFLEKIQSLKLHNFSCIGCSGVCCTFEKNSMKITPLETFEILVYFYENDLLDEELIRMLKATISRYRLDSDLGNGERSFLRRNYTCPFFEHKELGCSLEWQIKPYGCLAFNPNSVNKEGENCESDINLLEKNEECETMKSQNKRIKSEFGITWDKAYIPMAIVDMASRINY